MKKIIYYVLFILATTCEVNAAGATAAGAGYAVGGDSIFIKGTFLPLIEEYLGGRPLEGFSAEAVGAITNIDLLLMAGSVLASEIATHPENFPLDIFKPTTVIEIVGAMAKRPGMPSLLNGCDIIDIVRPLPVSVRAGFKFPDVVGITLNTHTHIGKITCFGSTSFTSIRDLLLTYAAVHMGGDINAVVADARDKLVRQWLANDLPHEEFSSKLGIPLTGNLLEKDPLILGFLANEWKKGCIQLMDKCIRENTPTAVCGPFFVQEMIQSLQLMGGKAAEKADRILAVSYNSIMASNALLRTIETILNGANIDNFEMVSISIGNGAPVGGEVSSFRAYGRSNTLFRWGAQWGNVLNLPDVGVFRGLKKAAAFKSSVGAGGGSRSSALSAAAVEISGNASDGGGTAGAAPLAAVTSAAADPATKTVKAPGLLATFMNGLPFVGGSWSGPVPPDFGRAYAALTPAGVATEAVRELSEEEACGAPSRANEGGGKGRAHISTDAVVVTATERANEGIGSGAEASAGAAGVTVADLDKMPAVSGPAAFMKGSMSDSFDPFEMAEASPLSAFFTKLPFPVANNDAVYTALQVLAGDALAAEAELLPVAVPGEAQDPHRPYAPIGRVYAPAGFFPDMASSVRASMDGSDLLLSATEGGAAVHFKDVPAGADARLASRDPAAGSATVEVGWLSWLLRTVPVEALIELLRARGVNVSSFLPTKSMIPKGPWGVAEDARLEMFIASVLAAHSPEAILADLAISYAVQKWPDIAKEHAKALQLDSALKAVAEVAGVDE